MKNTNKYKLNIKTMKKGLLTLLAASLVFVGCQNYDDQFDDLNAQISALKSQVDGLSALSGQVSSLSSTISGLQSGVTAAQAAASAIDLSGLEASLASLATEVDDIQADLATAATAADITALEADLAAVQADLDDLLSTSNVYQGNVTIASATNLDAFNDLGSAINIVNGNVTITNLATYDQAKVQAVINNIFAVNGSYTFTDIADAVSANTASPTFDNMTSAGDITMTEMNGAVSFATLATAGAIVITGDSWDHDGDEAADTAAVQAITSFSAPLLTTADELSVNGADSVTLTTVGTSVNINSLAAVSDTDVTGLSITTGTGGTLTAAALTSPLDAQDDETFALTIAGLASFTAPTGVTGGTLTVSATPTLVVDGFQGTVDINTGVTSFTGTDVTNVDVAGADELVSASIDYAAETANHNDYSADNDNAKGQGLGSLTVNANQADLNDLTISGTVNDVTISASSVVTVTISATMDALSISTSDDLTGLSISDATIGDIVLNDNDEISAIVIDNAHNLAYTGGDAATGLTLTVTNSDDLESLTVSGTGFDDVDVTGNSTLSTIDFSGVTAIGAGANYQITGNDLNAASITETDASESEGSIDDGTSGMDTLTATMAALTAQTAAVASIRFDSAETITAEAGEVNNGNDVAWNDGTGDDALLLVYSKGGGSAAGDDTAAVTEVKAFGVVGAANATLNFTLNGVTITLPALTGDKDDDVAAIIASAGADTAAAAGATVSAVRGFNNSSSITMSVITAGYSAALYGERYTTQAALAAATTDTGGVYGIGQGDEFTLTIGSESVTASLSADSVLASDLAKALVDAWPTAGTNYSLSKGITDTAHIISIASSNTAMGPETYNQAVTLALSAQSTATTETSAALDYIIGDTRATNDNSTVDAGFIVTFTSLAAGADDNTIVTLANGNGSATETALTATSAPDTVFTGTNGAAGAAAVSGVTTDHSSWL